MELSYFNIQKFCIHDGPGIRTTVFLKGCPLDCLWCHNPESKRTDPEIMFYRHKCLVCGRCLDFCSARSITADGQLIYDREKCLLCGKCTERCYNTANSLCGKKDTTENILAEVKKDLPFYKTSGGGMTVSGGEPAMQSKAVIELVRMAKEEGIESVIETSGFGERDFFMSLHELGATFFFDIKGIDREKHKINTGVYPDVIHKNLDALIAEGAKIVLRLPMIPGKNDSDVDLALLRDFIAERKDHIEYAEIMPYHEMGRDKNTAVGREVYDPIPAGKQFAEKWREFLSLSGAEIRVSGE